MFKGPQTNKAKWKQRNSHYNRNAPVKKRTKIRQKHTCLLPHTPLKSYPHSTNHSPLFHKKAFNVKTEVPESLLKQKSWVTHHKKEQDTEITANLKNSQKTVLTPN